MKKHGSIIALFAGLILFIGTYHSIALADATETAKPSEAAKPPEITKPPEKTKPAGAEKTAKPAETAKPAAEPSLKVTSRSKSAVTLELQNDVPVRALQFTVHEAKITEVRTTDRTKGFLAKFNEKNGKVIILSTAGDEIAPGKGAITEIVCDKPAAAALVDVTIVWNR